MPYSSTLDDSLLLQHQIVAFLDAVGQSSRLLRLDAMVRHHASRSALGRAYSDSVGYLLQLRGYLQRKLMTSVTFPPRLRVPAHVRRFFEDARRVTFIGMSDSIAIAASLPDDRAIEAATFRIFHILNAARFASLHAFRNRRLLRGGIALGYGSQLTQNEMHGAGLVEAVQLEKDLAHWPRTVVHPRVVRLLVALRRRRSQGRFAALSRKTANDSLRMIRRDRDGLWFVDVFADDPLLENKDVRTMIAQSWKSAYDMVHESLRLALSRGDAKTAGYSSQLAAYLEKRSRPWKLVLGDG